MGFTIGIGGTRGMRDLRSATRRRVRASECTAVAEFTGLWGWDVVPGARAAGGACSCGRRDCPAPGAHPLDFAPEVPAGATLDEASEAWAQFPGAALMLPVGRRFDVIEVAEPAGVRALARLERMGLPLGRSRRPRRAAPTSSSHPAPPPSCPGCSTAWAGTTPPPSTCAASAPARTSRRRPPTGADGARCAGCARRPSTRRRSPRRPACCWGPWRTWRTARGRRAAGTHRHTPAYGEAPAPAGVRRGRALLLVTPRRVTLR